MHVWICQLTQRKQLDSQISDLKWAHNQGMLSASTDQMCSILIEHVLQRKVGFACLHLISVHAGRAAAFGWHHAQIVWVPAIHFDPQASQSTSALIHFSSAGPRWCCSCADFQQALWFLQRPAQKGQVTTSLAAPLCCLASKLDADIRICQVKMRTCLRRDVGTCGHMLRCLKRRSDTDLLEAQRIQVFSA